MLPPPCVSRAATTVTSFAELDEQLVAAIPFAVTVRGCVCGRGGGECVCVRARARVCVCVCVLLSLAVMVHTQTLITPGRLSPRLTPPRGLQERGVDLKLLTDSICAAELVVERDEPWEFLSVFTEIKSELQTEREARENAEKEEDGQAIKDLIAV